MPPRRVGQPVLCPATGPGSVRNPVVHPDPIDGLDAVGSVLSCRRSEALFREGDPATRLYRVVSGACRRYMLHADGRRQIVAFLLPGDLFGFCAERVHAFGVDAIGSGTAIAHFELDDVDALCRQNPLLRRRFVDVLLESMAHLEGRLTVLGWMRARDRVAAFLEDMAKRAPDEADVISLPMSRCDIADYLALTVETVSRVLSELRSRGAIAKEGSRRIRVLNWGALREPVLQAGAA